MTNKILILGAADLSDAWIFINSGFDCSNLIVTELRTESELIATYGTEFILNLQRLREKNVRVMFGIDATTLSRQLLEDVYFVFWGSPYFERDNFNEILQKFFNTIDNYSQSSNNTPPLIGLGLDCLGPDSQFNLTTRFNAFNIKGWSVKFFVDLKGRYQFTPSNPAAEGRKKLPQIVTENVLTLIYCKSSEIAQFNNIKHQPFWIPTNNTTSRTHYVNIFQIPAVMFIDFISLLIKGIDITLIHNYKFKTNTNEKLLPYTYIDKERIKYLNSFSNPTNRHPLRPTAILKELSSAHLSDIPWEEVWKHTKGGFFFTRYYRLKNFYMHKIIQMNNICFFNPPFPQKNSIQCQNNSKNNVIANIKIAAIPN